MTFRPSDGVLDDLDSNQNPLVENQNNESSNNLNQLDWQEKLGQSDVIINWENNEWELILWKKWVSINDNEIKAPDLSELLEKNPEKNDWSSFNETSKWQERSLNLVDEIADGKWWIDNNVILLEEKQDSDVGLQKGDIDLGSIEWIYDNDISESEDGSLSDGGITDKDRYDIVSKIMWSIHSKLDLLVDNEWYFFVDKYKKIHRIIFRWWIFIITLILWWTLWVIAQVYGNQPLYYKWFFHPR